MEDYYSHLQNFQISDATSTRLESLGCLNEIISSSQHELDFFYETGDLQFVLKLLNTNEEMVHICLKILLNASKKSEKFRKELIKRNIFYVLSVQLKKKANFSKKNLVLCTALIVLLVHGNDDAQDQIRTSGCLSYLMYTLNILLADADIKPLPHKNTELLIYSIIASNKDPRHLENQTEVGWITPKIVKYLGRQTIFSSSEQIQIVKCFWSFLKSILHKNESNQQIFVKSSGFTVLFRSMQEIVDENKSEEFGTLLIRMTGVLIRLKSQKEFLYQASSYCSLMILCRLLNTNNPIVIQNVIIFTDSLTQEIPHALQPIIGKHILQGLIRAKIILSKNNMSSELCQSIWARILPSTEVPFYFKPFTQPTNFPNLLKNDGLNNEFCPIHGIKNLQKVQLQSDFFDVRRHKQSFSRAKVNETNRVNIWSSHVRNKLKGRKVLSGKLTQSVDKKRENIARITTRKIIHLFGKLLSLFR